MDARFNRQPRSPVTSGEKANSLYIQLPGCLAETQFSKEFAVDWPCCDCFNAMWCRHSLPGLPVRRNLSTRYVDRAEVDSEHSIRLALEVDSLGRPILDEYCSKFF